LYKTGVEWSSPVQAAAALGVLQWNGPHWLWSTHKRRGVDKLRALLQEVHGRREHKHENTRTLPSLFPLILEINANANYFAA
jgi:hypothetical protein